MKSKKEMAEDIVKTLGLDADTQSRVASIQSAGQLNKLSGSIATANKNSQSIIKYCREELSELESIQAFLKSGGLGQVQEA